MLASNQTQLEPVRPIVVILYVPSQFVHPLKVKTTQKVSDLQKVFPYGESKTFVYDGRVLSSDETLEFYRINDKDIIFAFDDNSSIIKNRSKTLAAFGSCNTVFEAMRRPILAEIRSEAHRIRDLRMNSIEQKARVFQKVCTSVLNMDNGDFNDICSCYYQTSKKTGNNDNQITENDEKCNRNDFELNVDFIQLDKPSEESLPICW
ncbi:hypothetical protein TRFO_36824 [Tritrichomonas foetus]|uniref:Ubiquitin-like domain-containing protein n=1 Tax=Tritrichomonas foetus TaxID=1144522 RepID=A0A1J4JCU0_9EUKA|nr:hypothetical protein TRFO_36824 [Tritrichomonas foetus]|eukprot:OHS97018.1 hypothetical protein TRFO_36824 [Tritrichomonas foetus]